MNRPDLPELAILDALEFGVIVLDRASQVTVWNAWLQAATGIAAETALGEDLSTLLPSAGSGRLKRAIAEALDGGASSLLTHALHPSLFALRTRTGVRLIHNVSVRPGGQKPYAYCVVQITDVSVAVHRERVLRQRQNARYDAVVDSAPDAILTLDEFGVIQLANPAAALRLGYSVDELTGAGVTVLFEEQSGWQEVWREVLREGRLGQTVELQARRKDGTSSYLEVSAAQWRNDTRVFVTVILRDVNARRDAEEALRGLNETLEQRIADAVAERNRMEEALRQSQKMEAIGQLTGGIAHDFNNLLTGIIGAMDLMKRRLASGRTEDLPRFMDAASASANRAAALTHRLLAFARRQPLDPKPLCANALIAGMEDLLRRTLGERVRLHVDLTQDMWPALTDASQLENSVLNLAINARDAMPEGGDLTIATRNQTLAAREVQAHGEDIEAGDYILIEVSDSGAGMPAEVLAKVFEPFFTTKPLGEGTGLGLSMIYGFAKQSRGHVHISSTMGQGTNVCLYLPRHLGDFEADILPPETAAPRGDGETVLLVEDDPAVRLLIGEVLRDLGYACIEAGEGQAALPILTSNVRLDLMITDIGLPGMNGRQLADIARHHRPDLKVLFVTGYAEHATGSEGFLEPGMAMVTKPFALDALALRIRDIIRSPTPSAA